MGCRAAKTHQVLTGAHSHEPSRRWRQKRRPRLSEAENDREENTGNQMDRLASYSFLITPVSNSNWFFQRSDFIFPNSYKHENKVSWDVSKCAYLFRLERPFPSAYSTLYKHLKNSLVFCFFFKFSSSGWSNQFESNRWMVTGREVGKHNKNISKSPASGDLLF